MRKFFAIIFLLVAAFLLKETVLYITYAFEDGFRQRNWSEPSYVPYAVITSILIAIISVLTWLGIKWLKTPPRASSEAIDDELIGR